MSSNFPLFKRADSGMLNKILKLFTPEKISEEIKEFQDETKGKSLADTISFLPKFISREWEENVEKEITPSQAAKLGPELEKKYKQVIKSEFMDTTPHGKPIKLTRLEVVPASLEESRNFYREVLRRIGAPPTEENLLFMEAWRHSEGGRAAFNPFNTTRKSKEPGYSNYAKAGEKNFPSKEAGIQATVDTLNKGIYRHIVAALKKGDSAKEVALALSRPDAATGLQWGTKDLVYRVLNGKGFPRKPIYYLPENDSKSNPNA